MNLPTKCYIQHIKTEKNTKQGNNIKNGKGDSDMGYQVEVLATKSDYLSSIPSTYR